MTAMRTIEAKAMPMSRDRLKIQRPFRSNPIEGCVQIGYQVVDVFETD